jgi:16S rRNA (uracil1498-N3)-methyltransferase
MRVTRLFVNEPLTVGQALQLSEEATHHLVNVLRLNQGAKITLFNGMGGEYESYLINYQKKRGWVQIQNYHPIERESPLPLTLVQAVSRPDHMDYTIQKAVELGVKRIVPILTERSVPIAKNKIGKREERWRKIIEQACAQCGRNQLPILHKVSPLSEWLATMIQGQRLILTPIGTQQWYDSLEQTCPITMLVGAEGGLTEQEIQQAERAGYLSVRLGPRILRTETAAIAMLVLCQAFGGDWR